MDNKKLIKNYKLDIIDIYNLYNKIHDNLNIEVNIEKIDLNENMPSFYKIYILFSKNIIKKEYVEYLSNNFTFNIKNINKEIDLISKLLKSFDKNIIDVKDNIELDKKQINKLNSLFEKTKLIKKLLCDILYYDINLLPNELKNIKHINFFSQHKLLYNNFISFDINESIKKMKYVIKVNYNNQKLFHLYCYNNKQCSFIKKKILKHITTRILFLSNYLNVKKLPFLNIFYTNEKKKLSLNKKKIIYTPKEVNSAATDNNSLIMIWRKEELLKSILHECIHFYNLDIKNKIIKNNYNIYFKKLFNVNKNNFIDIGESYTEMNACFLNCIFYINEKKKKIKDTKIIIKTFDENLKKEKKFSQFQVSKILYLQSYKKFDDFYIKNKKKEINQTTNLISYHIIKSAFLHYINEIYQINSKDNLVLNFDSYSNIKNQELNNLINIIFDKSNSLWIKLINKNMKTIKKTKKNKNFKSLKMVLLS